MDEQSWFESSDPVAMWNYLHYSSYEEGEYGGTTNQSRRPSLISKRKESLVDAAFLNTLDCNTPAIMTATLSKKTGQFASQIIRDFVGNPFARLETAHDQAKPSYSAWKYWGFYSSEWLTPTVVSLAEACYDNVTEGKKCRTCNGRGRFCSGECHGNPDYREYKGCLDPDRLGILSDAIEDAGCTEEIILRSLRGEVQTCEYVNLGQGTIKGFGKGAIAVKQMAWKKREVPLFRGFWVTDLLLNLE